MEIEFFNAKTQKFVESLEPRHRPKTSRAFELLEEYGNNLGLPHSKSLGGGLFELRIVGTIQLRFLYAFHEDKIWMLHALIKKANSIPKADIDYAKKQLKALASI